MVDTKQARWVYRVARFAGVCFCGLDIFFCFAETNICDEDTLVFLSEN